MSYFLYILKSTVADKYYTGITENPDRRLHFENTIEKGFTARYRPWERVYLKECPDKKEARRLELKIKRWKSKRMIEKLISGEIKL